MITRSRFSSNLSAPSNTLLSATGEPMPIPDLVSGVLPPGRHTCTQSEILGTFVVASEYDNSSTRVDLFDDWLTGVALLTSAVTVYVAWISGSFASDKLDPQDIDVTFIISESDRHSRGPADQKIVESFLPDGTNPSTQQLLRRHGLRLDSYLIGWDPYHLDPASGQMPTSYRAYAQARGYWDDWWSRTRKTPKGQPPVRVDALPERGYLEVRFNAYA